jgi:hypothetical protein
VGEPIVASEEAAALEQPASAATWLGNTFPADDDRRAVQRTISDLFVLPDGTVLSYSYFKGGGYRAVLWKDGERVGRLGSGAGGGNSITSDGTYIYVDDYLAASGRRIARFALDGAGTDVAFPLPATAEARGLVVHDGALYVSDAVNHELLVFDLAKPGPPARRFAVQRPGELAVDGEGRLWVVQERPGAASSLLATAPGEAAILAFEPKTGRPIADRAIRDVVDPRDVTIDPRGRLWVADAGQDYQLRVYAMGPSGAPALEATFGDKGGIFSGTPGEVAAGKLNQPNAVGVDAAGNVYVNSAMRGLGARLEAYAPDGRRRWEVTAVGATYDGAAPDPGADGDVYGKAFRFRLDFAQPVARQWRLVGFTEGSFLHDRVPPDDDKERDSPLSIVWGVRRVGGRPIVFTTQTGGHAILAAYRRAAGELLAPCAIFGKRGGGSWPPGQPGSGTPWLWRDADGDGRFDPGEIAPAGSAAFTGDDWHADDTGAIWIGGAAGELLRLRAEGLDPHGCPAWDATRRDVYKLPEPFDKTGVQSVAYEPATDTMLLTGYSPAFPKPASGPDGGYAGRMMARFSRFTDPARRQKAWEVPFEWNVTPGGTPHNVSLTGRYLFVGYETGAVVRVHELDAGKLVALLEPRAPVVAATDNGSVSAGLRPNGEYLAFMDEGIYRKVIVYRWHPGAPQRLQATAAAGRVTLSWAQPIEGAPATFHVYRSRTGPSGYVRLTSLPQSGTTYEDADAQRGLRYQYRVAVTPGAASARPIFSYEVTADVP